MGMGMGMGMGGLMSLRISIVMFYLNLIIMISTLIFVLSSTVSAYYNDDGDKASAYEALEQYNFPVGLLPSGATGYRLNRETGEFSAYLNASCSFTLENSYQLRYKPVIKGVISEGRLQKLSGVSVKLVLMWLNILEVKRNNENLEFSVGFTSANFPVRNFEECPHCGCGLDCHKLIRTWSSSS